MKMTAEGVRNLFNDKALLYSEFRQGEYHVEMYFHFGLYYIVLQSTEHDEVMVFVEMKLASGTTLEGVLDKQRDLYLSMFSSKVTGGS
jgi:hypothetical protein